MGEKPSRSSSRGVSTAVSRRSVLAGVATVTTAGIAGCTALIDELTEMILGDVNVFNETAKPLAGSVGITGPDGSSVLAERFELAVNTDTESDSETSAVFDDVWQAAGTYEVTVELDDGIEVRGESRADESVTIDDPDNQKLAIAFGLEDEASGISLTVGESLGDFEG